jgi:hypothetical protein
VASRGCNLEKKVVVDQIADVLNQSRRLFLRVQGIGVNTNADPKFLDISTGIEREKIKYHPRYQDGNKNNVFGASYDLSHAFSPFLL